MVSFGCDGVITLSAIRCLRLVRKRQSVYRIPFSFSTAKVTTGCLTSQGRITSHTVIHPHKQPVATEDSLAWLYGLKTKYFNHIKIHLYSHSPKLTVKTFCTLTCGGSEKTAFPSVFSE